MQKIKENDNPLISVIMGIYNCETTLTDAVNCILNQTVNDFEIIMCDDGSKDGTYVKACELAEKTPMKIYVIRNDTNRGLANALNKCLKASRGRYIARMDGDDLCSPERFEKELRIFLEKPEISIVSSDMLQFDEKGIWGRASRPEIPKLIDFLHETPFFHAPSMMKVEALKKVNGYSEDERVLRVEDYHLWVKMYAAGFKGINIKDPLYQMRDDRNAFHRRKFKYRMNEAYVIAEAVKKLHLPIVYLIFALRPLILGIIPYPIYAILHRWKHKR